MTHGLNLSWAIETVIQGLFSLQALTHRAEAAQPFGWKAKHKAISHYSAARSRVTDICQACNTLNTNQLAIMLKGKRGAEHTWH